MFPHPISKKTPIKILIIFLFAGGYAFAYLYTPHASFTGSKSVEIAKGDGSRTIGQKLKNNGFIGSKWAFIIYTSLANKSSSLKPGSFVLDSNNSIPQITEMLLRGEKQERVIVVPEGWNISDIAAYLEKENVVSRNEFLRAAGGATSEQWQKLIIRFPFLAEVPRSSGLEGYLFPDTYRIFKNSSAKEIVIKMLENFEKKIPPEWQQETTRQNKNLFKEITMASMLENEVKTDEDRALVSGILWRRLEIGMGLQVDATIVYILQNSGLYAVSPTKISANDTKLNSLYNTYKYAGLPPGPISNPGLSAIKAAIYPKKSEYLYYLSTRDGKTVFSQTLKEHNIAKAKYLK